VFAYRYNLSGGRFYVIWAGLTAFVHFEMKVVAATLSSLPENLNMIILNFIRLVAISLSIWVVVTSWQEIKHIPHHIKGQEPKVSLHEKWSFERAHLWVPAILLGGIDAYPIGTIKGLLLTKPDLLKTCLSSTLGSAVVGLITLSVAHLVLRIEKQLSPFHVGTLILGRVLHLSIFTGITLAIMIEWYYVLVNSKYTQGHIWLTPFIAAFLMAVFLLTTHWSRWRGLMELATRKNKHKS
jgi:hypothetical protein